MGRKRYSVAPAESAPWPVTKAELASLVEEGTDVALERDWDGLRELANRLKVDVGIGLDEAQEVTEQRREHFGANTMTAPGAKPKNLALLEAMQSTPTVLLLLLSIVLVVLGLAFGGGLAEARTKFVAALVGCVALTALASFMDLDIGRRINGLQSTATDVSAVVRRRGEMTQVSVTELVVGDVVEVNFGDCVPADGIFVDGSDLRLDESDLTGDLAVATKDETNPFLLEGTAIMEGFGHMLVVAVGVSTQRGAILKMMHADDDEATVLQGKLERVAGKIGKLGSSCSLLVFLLLSLRSAYDIFFVSTDEFSVGALVAQLCLALATALAVAVVSVPSTLPISLSTSVAHAGSCMLGDQCLLQHLDACELSSGVTTICTDKTGTLTTNRMSVMNSWLAGREYKAVPPLTHFSASFLHLLNCGICINSTATLQDVREGARTRVMQLGNKTECALLQFSRSMGQEYEDIRQRMELLKLYTFTSVRKRMSVVVSDLNVDQYTTGNRRLFIKGAAEILLRLCTGYLSEDGETVVDMTEGVRSELEDAINRFAKDGLRTLMMATRLFLKAEDPPQWVKVDDAERDLVCLGIVGIEDPLRDDVPGAIRACQGAGITVRMVTGENVQTAMSVASKCTIYDSQLGHSALEGADFRQRVLDPVTGQINMDEFDAIWPHLRVLARCSPADKQVLVQGLKNTGSQVVAATGDGAHDGAALRKADVGFAMHISGTEVARRASDVIVLDDNFVSIMQAIKWGRGVVDSLSRALQFQLTQVVPIVIVVLYGVIAVGDSPLTPAQLLWMSVLLDPYALLLFARETPTNAVFQRKPYGPKKALISKQMWRAVLGHAALQCGVLLSLLARGHTWLDVADGRSRGAFASPSAHYTVIFTTAVCFQLFSLLAARKVYGELNILGPCNRSGAKFYASIGAVAAVQVAITQFGGEGFGCVDGGLTLVQWGWCWSLAALTVPWTLVLRFVPLQVLPPAIGKKAVGGEQLRQLRNKNASFFRMSLRNGAAYKSDIARFSSLKSSTAKSDGLMLQHIAKGRIYSGRGVI